jgi:putative ABC transport system permease protein
MYRHLLYLALRNFRRDLFYSLLNLIGLIAGLTSAIILFVFVHNELSYDQFHPSHKKIFRLTTTFISKERESNYALNEGIWDNHLENTVGVASSTIFYPVQSNLVFSIGETVFSENKGLFADEDFLAVFDFKLLTGNRETVLTEPNSIIITSSMAERLFRSTDVYGKTITWKDQGVELKVTGVMDIVPNNSHVKFDFIISGSTQPLWKDFSEGKYRGSNVFHVFFKTHTTVPTKELQSQIDTSIKSIQVTDEANGLRYRLSVQPLKEIYFHAKNEFEITEGGNYEYVKIFFLVSISLILITTINYVNLSTSRSLTRIKEVGVRKALGTTKANLVTQFLVESVQTTVTASVLSGFIAHLILKNFISPKFPINLDSTESPLFIIGLVILGIVLGVIAGLYPATKLASFKTTAALKGTLILGKERVLGPRNSLVLLQLVVTIVLISFSAIVFRQLVYLNNKDLGYDKNNLIYFIQPGSISNDQWSLFKDQLHDLAGVTQVGASFYPLIEGSELGRMSSTHVRLQEETESFVMTSWNAVDFEFIKAMKMEFVQGRNFTPQDTTSVILNETAAVSLGITETGTKKIKWWKGTFDVIGIVRDFHFKSFQNRITPVIFILDKPVNTQGLGSRILFARANNQSMKNVVEQAKSSWLKLQIDAPFEYRVFDDNFQILLKKENETSSIITAFTFISLLITGIGLLGVVGLTNERRKKEISIRKVLGATLSDIVLMLSRNYIRILSFSCLIALPIIIWLSNNWLSDFEYKEKLNPWVLLLTATSLAMTILLIVCGKSYRASRANPADVLRNE